MVARRILVLAVAALVLGGFGASPAASHDDAPRDGIVVMSSGSTDHEGELQWFECANEPQLALGVVDVPGCGDYGGDHVLSSDHYYVTVGFRIGETGTAGPLPLTGTLEAVLFWDQDEIVLRCHWSDGHWDGCDISIPRLPPPPGEPFRFRCESVPGTIGHWGDCFMAHS